MRSLNIETRCTNGVLRMRGLLPFALVLLMAVPMKAAEVRDDSIATQHDSIVTVVEKDTSTVTEATSEPPKSKYERVQERRLKGWDKLIPNQGGIQFAGSIGLINLSVGWHYGRNDHWETDLLFGFVPKYHSESAHFTFTVKERYVPWHCDVHPNWTIEPLTAGIFFNTITGPDFWSRQPDRYPKNYYWFSTRIRTNIFLGQRLRFNIPPNKRIAHQSLSVYYEISTCDLYVCSKVNNKDFPLREMLSLAFGLRWEM